MQLVLVIAALIQLHQYAASVNAVHKADSNFPPKFKVPAGVYELRRISEDEIGSIKPDRIVTVEEDQSILKASAGNQNAYQYLKKQQQQAGAGDGDDYTQAQRGYPSEVVSDGRHNYMHSQGGYQAHVVNQNSEASGVPAPGSDASKYTHMGYLPLGMASPTAQNDNSQSGLASPPSGQHYMQSVQQGAQPGLTNYQVVNENSNPGAVSISLPGGYEATGNAQNYMHQSQQIPEGYQVVNEDAGAHVVSLPPSYLGANGNDNYSGSGAGPFYTQPKNEVYMPYEGSYIPQNQQFNLQYHARSSQHVPMQIPMPFVGGMEGLQQHEQLWNMIRNSRMVSNSSPQPKQN